MSRHFVGDADNRHGLWLFVGRGGLSGGQRASRLRRARLARLVEMDDFLREHGLLTAPNGSVYKWSPGPPEGRRLILVRDDAGDRHRRLQDATPSDPPQTTPSSLPTATATATSTSTSTPSPSVRLSEKPALSTHLQLSSSVASVPVELGPLRPPVYWDTVLFTLVLCSVALVTNLALVGLMTCRLCQLGRHRLAGDAAGRADQRLATRRRDAVDKPAVMRSSCLPLTDEPVHEVPGDLFELPRLSAQDWRAVEANRRCDAAVELSRLDSLEMDDLEAADETTSAGLHRHRRTRLCRALTKPVPDKLVETEEDAETSAIAAVADHDDDDDDDDNNDDDDDDDDDDDKGEEEKEEEGRYANRFVSETRRNDDWPADVGRGGGRGRYRSSWSGAADWPEVKRSRTNVPRRGVQVVSTLTPWTVTGWAGLLVGRARSRDALSLAYSLAVHLGLLGSLLAMVQIICLCSALKIRLSTSLQKPIFEADAIPPDADASVGPTDRRLPELVCLLTASLATDTLLCARLHLVVGLLIIGQLVGLVLLHRSLSV
ncbi:unnamed protein product, partial [Protopolystoma xenopodis]